MDEQLKEWRERWNNGDVKFVPELFDRLETSDKIDKKLLLEGLQLVINHSIDKKALYHKEDNVHMAVHMDGMIAGFKVVEEVIKRNGWMLK